MLRAISEIAVAIIVTSVNEKPSWRASSCPAWRAVTISSGLLMSTTKSVGTIASDRRLPVVELAVQQCKTLFQVQRGVHVVEGQPQLNHGERDFGLQTHDHRVRAAQPGHVRDGSKRPRGK